MKNELPIIKIHGIDFLIDVNKFELREKNNPTNTLSVFSMNDFQNGYEFGLNTETKGFDYEWMVDLRESNTCIPHMARLDPMGMAKKLGLHVAQVKNKTDFELMVDQDAYHNRVIKNVIPTLEIAGHRYEVDMGKNMLRSTQDVYSTGINFSAIEKYFDLDDFTYKIPYNTKTHQSPDLDYLMMKELPKDIIIVSFPAESVLDRIGWNRKYGYDVTYGLMQNGLKLNFKAEQVPFEKLLKQKNMTKKENSKNSSDDVKGRLTKKNRFKL